MSGGAEDRLLRTLVIYMNRLGETAWSSLLEMRSFLKHLVILRALNQQRILGWGWGRALGGKYMGWESFSILIE